MINEDNIRAKLNDVHTFPGPYLFKVIGPNTDSFVSLVVQGVILASGPDSNHQVTTRESSGGNHLSISITIEARSADHVLDVYRMFSTMEEIKFVL